MLMEQLILVFNNAFLHLDSSPNPIDNRIAKDSACLGVKSMFN